MLSATYKSEILDSDKKIYNFDMKHYKEYIIISNLFDVSDWLLHVCLYVCFLVQTHDR